MLGEREREREREREQEERGEEPCDTRIIKGEEVPSVRGMRVRE